MPPEEYHNMKRDTKLLGKLCMCQIINNDDELYEELNNLNDDEYSQIVHDLSGYGYGIKYNNLEDCYVIY